MKKFYKPFATVVATCAALASVQTASATYPSVQDIIGWYDFSSILTEVEDGLPFTPKASFTFEIEDNFGALKINNFLWDNANYFYIANYDQQTGQISFLKKYFTYNSLNFGIFQLGGSWNYNATTDPVVWQVNEDGSITIPDFQVGSFTLSPAEFTPLAKYEECRAVESNNNGSSEDNGSGNNVNSPLSGLWTVTTSDPFLGETDTTDELQYEVTVSGKTVTFRQVTDYDNGDNFVGQIEEDGVTVTFNQAMLVNAIYPKYQFPYTNGNQAGVTLNNLNIESFSAKFDEKKGTLTFPTGVGLRIGNVDPTTLELVNNWQQVFNLLSATRERSYQPSINITMDNFEISTDNVTVIYNFTTSHLDMTQSYDWRANVLQIIPQEENDDLTVPVDGCSLLMNTNKRTATIIIPDLKDGKYTFSITISAFEEGAGENSTPIVTSNTRTLSVEVGASVGISLYSIDVEDNSITVTFSCNLSSIPDESYYMMRFTPASEFKKTDGAGNPIEPDIEASSIYVDANIINGYATGILTDIEEGSDHEYVIALIVYNEEGEVIATSNNVNIKVVVTGVGSVDTENTQARYFNLNGVEISKPSDGMYIKVEKGKTTKHIKR